MLSTSGSPCQGLSGANALAKGFDDPRTQLFFESLRIIKDVAAEKHRIFFLNENVASMSGENRDQFSKFLRVQPVCADAADICRVRRRRYFWLNWGVPPCSDVEAEPRDGYTQLRFRATLPPDDTWVDNGWRFEGSPEERLPTFMRAIPKDKPTFLPSGIVTPKAAQERWKADDWRYAPYQYKDKFLLRNKARPHIVRVATATEREAVMFFGHDYTRMCMNPTVAKSDPQAHEDCRCSLVGNAFHTGIVALLLAPLFHGLGLLQTRPTPDEIVLRMHLPPGEVHTEGRTYERETARQHEKDLEAMRGKVHPSAEAAKQGVSSGDTKDLQSALLGSFFRAADYRGSDVRIDSGELMRPHSWPRRSIDPARWSWYSLLATPFTREEHINVLELKTILLMLRWRLRASNRVHSRFLHLCDSQVCLGVVVKGRSSSWRLNRVLNRINSHVLAGSLAPNYAFVRSDWNPSDPPSRRFMGQQVKKRATPRHSRATQKRPPLALSAKGSSAATPSSLAPSIPRRVILAKGPSV